MATSEIELAKAKFWARVKVGTDAQCWEYSGPDQGTGYGQFRFPCGALVPMLAHRLAWQIINDREIGDLVIMHVCDNKRCVNPSHLVPGTQAENLADMRAKGRAPKLRGKAGEANPAAKMTEQEARSAKAAIRAGADRASVAKVIGVSMAAINRLMSGKSWKHLP